MFRLKRKITAALGLSAVLIFGITLVVIASLTPGFHFLEDYVSELGAQDQPYTLSKICLTQEINFCNFFSFNSTSSQGRNHRNPTG